jgi:G3E family GTPase
VQRLPLTVIGGFLGAGKTTLLNHLLRSSSGRRIAALVNDFGALNIDAELIAANAGDTIALANGCVCCSIGDDLSRALARVLEAPARFDAIVIEASGVSDPWRIAQVGLADPGLALEAVIVLLDASAALDQARDPLLADSLERQLRGADLIVVNKIDRVDAAQRRLVREWAVAVAGDTPQIETVQAALPAPLLFGVTLPRTRGARAEEPACAATHSHDHAQEFESWSLQPASVLSAPALRRLLREMPAGVLRLKGLVRSDEHGWVELQFAGRHGSLRPTQAPASGAAAVVAIALHGRLPRAALEHAFRCAEPASNRASPS